MDRLHLIGFAPQSDESLVPMYASKQEVTVCECGVSICPEQCLCDCHYREAVKTLIKAVLVTAQKMVSVSDLLHALHVAAIPLPDNSSEAWQFVADMRYKADKERGEG